MDPAARCPMAWTERFAQHHPDHPQCLVDGWAAVGIKGTDQHTGHLAHALISAAGYDCWEGETVTRPPQPTAAQDEAYRMVERLLELTSEYQAATGDRFPVAVFGLQCSAE